MTLHEFIQKQGMTTSSVATALGVSQPYISRLLRGERTCSPRLAMRIEDWSGGKVAAANINAVLAEHAGRRQRSKRAA